jgi:Flp pilus assembly protein TadG
VLSVAGRRRATDQGERGQSLVEFALVLPVFFLIVFAIIQFGMIMGAQDGLANSVREATRYAATVPVSNTGDAGTCSANGTAGKQTYDRLLLVLAQKVPAFNAANLVACGAPAPASTVTYCVRQNPDATYSIWVQVTAVYRHQLFIPVIAAIVDRMDGTADNRLRATASEQMRVETFTLTSTVPGGFATCA